MSTVEGARETLRTAPPGRGPKRARKCMGAELDCEKPAWREGEHERCEESQRDSKECPIQKIHPQDYNRERMTSGRSTEYCILELRRPGWGATQR